MTYPEQLKTLDWQKRRREIILRDKCVCQKCFNERIVTGKSNIIMPDVKWTSEHYVINFKLGTENQIKFLRTEYSIFNNEFNKDEKRLEMFIDNTALGTKLLAVRRMITDYSKSKSILREKINARKTNSSFTSIYSIKQCEKELEVIAIIEEKEKYQPYLIVPGLNVHHKKYLPNRMAWDYTDDYLMTVCRECHEEIHKEDFSFKKSQYDEGILF
jgi:5-methylcytosine-specific restriction endonuclease McrA